MSKPTPLSGFPELLPAQRYVEQQVIDSLRAHLRAARLRQRRDPRRRAAGPAAAQGRDRKEVYVLRRLQADDDGRRRRRLGLHFDLTVPFARYVLENAGKLDFPFRRYQIQKVWRGERPQEGRYREFTQADIDVVDRDTLPFHHDVEVALVMVDALRALPLPAAVGSRSTTASCSRASTAGLGHRGRRCRAACGRQAGQAAGGAVADAAGRRRRRHARRRPSCLALAEISAADDAPSSTRCARSA